MDPRSQITSAELNDQLRVGLQIFAEVRASRKALTEIAAVKKHLTEIETQSLKHHGELLAQVTEVNSLIKNIERPEKPQPPSVIAGLESASTGLGAALRVVEGGDRTIPSQAMELYRESSKAASASIDQWTQLKKAQLAKLNEALQKAGIAPIQISEVEREANMR